MRMKKDIVVVAPGGRSLVYDRCPSLCCCIGSASGEKME